MGDGEINAIAAKAAALWKSGADVEALLRFMRESGLSQARSIETLQATSAIDAIKVQIAVFYSDTWRDHWQRSVQTNEQLIEALILLAQDSGDQTTISETELDPSCEPIKILRHCDLNTESHFGDYAGRFCQCFSRRMYRSKSARCDSERQPLSQPLAGSHVRSSSVRNNQRLLSENWSRKCVGRQRFHHGE
jgi:hypothetical protein